ncbi:MAG TPA: SRPBCC domain-containing protein [Chitinophagaceae bacterium]|nr:SRPBCC domain-containing protein [Chitinophagaceae bacterium]
METTVKNKEEKKQQDFAFQNEIIINRVFDLPVSKMWQAWTEPEYFKKWWGPKGYTCPFSKMEAKVGGKYHSCMRGPDGKEYWATGVVKEFVPEKKLVVTDSFSDEQGNIRNASDYGMPGNWPRELLITVKMGEADGATKLTLQHEGVPPIMREMCIQGWNESFDKLENNIK